jgi:hypothetical protein
MRFLKRKRGFYVKRSTTFKTGPLDMIVTVGALIIFIHALLFGSFKAITLEENNTINETNLRIQNSFINKTGITEPSIYDKTKRVTMLSLQLFIAPIVLCYEMLLLCLEGKHRGRYLPWSFWYRMLQYKIILKLREGYELTEEYYRKK